MSFALAISSHKSHRFLSADAGTGGTGLELLWVDHAHPERLSLQTFIADTFRKTYSAEIHHFCDVLVGCRGKDGQWLAALGYTALVGRKGFLQQYLDAPVEYEIAARLQLPVRRADIVEVGNMAATHTGAARALIVGMTRHLHERRYRWVVFTATRALLNSFLRLRLDPKELAVADPLRLPDQAKGWGSYYDSQPQVMFGEIAPAYAKLVR